MRRLRLAAWAIFALLGIPLLYVAAAFAFALVPAAADDSRGEPSVEAFVLSNGVHTDLVFPLDGPGPDWTKIFPAAHFKSMPPDARYVAIGWGDREFYLNTPRWRDLTARRAVQALSGSGSSLAHVSFLRASDLGQGSFRVPLSVEQYTALTQFILGTLVLSGPQAVAVPGHHYGSTDAFFEARGSYNMFNTCNTWTGRGLRWAGLRIGAWTPFESNVTWHLQPGAPRADDLPPSIQGPAKAYGSNAGTSVVLHAKRNLIKPMD